MKTVMPQGANIQNSSVITATDLQRIKESVAKGIYDPHENDHKIKEEMHRTAKEIVKKWPNTIEANRRKKDEEKIKQKIEEEMKRRELDEQEAQYQHALRKEAIEKASQALFENQDFVKAFHSKLLFADALKERDEQMAIKHEKNEMDKEIEQDWVNTEKENMKNFDEKEKIKNEEKAKQRKQNAKFIRDQKDLAERRKARIAKENKIEGEMIKRQTEADLLKEYEKEYIKKQNAIEMATSLKHDNDNLQKLKEVRRQQEKDEIKQIEEFAKKREEYEQTLRDREKEKFQEKQKIRQKLIDTQIEKLKNIKINAEERLNNQIKEGEEKLQKDLDEKEKRFKDGIEAMKKNRLEEIQRKAEKKQQDKNLEEEFKEMYNMRNKELVVLNRLIMN